MLKFVIFFTTNSLLMWN